MMMVIKFFLYLSMMIVLCSKNDQQQHLHGSLLSNSTIIYLFIY